MVRFIIKSNGTYEIGYDYDLHSNMVRFIMKSHAIF